MVLFCAVRLFLHGGAVMIRASRTCWGERMFPALQKYAQKTHAELFAEARRPVDSLSEAHVEWLRQQMVIQNRLYREIKSHHDE
jgi:hypothetical protein